MIRINLLEDHHAKDKLLIQQQLVLAVLILFGSFALCGVWWQAKASAIKNTNEKIEVAKVELDKQKKIRKKVKKMEEKEKRLSSLLKAIDLLMSERLGVVAYFDNLNVILPKETWLTTLTDKGGRITVNGFSFSNNAVAKLMKSMQESEHFLRVELSEVTSTKINKEVLKKFKVTCMTVAAHKRALEEEKKKADEEAKKKKKKKRKRG